MAGYNEIDDHTVAITMQAAGARLLIVAVGDCRRRNHRRR
jgi:hypothetical protein